MARRRGAEPRTAGGSGATPAPRWAGFIRCLPAAAGAAFRSKLLPADWFSAIKAVPDGRDRGRCRSSCSSCRRSSDGAHLARGARREVEGPDGSVGRGCVRGCCGGRVLMLDIDGVVVSARRSGDGGYERFRGAGPTTVTMRTFLRAVEAREPPERRPPVWPSSFPVVIQEASTRGMCPSWDRVQVPTKSS